MTIYRISLSDAQADKLADWLSNTTGEVDSRVADEIRAQIPKPAEPPFGSVVRAPWSDKDLLWVCLWRGWQSETGIVTDWSQLRKPEVLRVGIGEPEPLAQWETELLNQQERREIASAVLSAMDVDQYLIDAVDNARPR